MAFSKLKVFVNHKPVGWLRELSSAGMVERVIVLSSMKATKFKVDSTELSWAMFHLQVPDRETPKSREPIVTTQLVRL